MQFNGLGHVWMRRGEVVSSSDVSTCWYTCMLGSSAGGFLSMKVLSLWLKSSVPWYPQALHPCEIVLRFVDTINSVSGLSHSGHSTNLRMNLCLIITFYFCILNIRLASYFTVKGTRLFTRLANLAAWRSRGCHLR